MPKDVYRKLEYFRFTTGVSRQGRSYLESALKQYRISKGQYIFILHVYDHPGISQDELAKALELDKGTVAKAVKKLIAKGFLRREGNPEDKRAYKLYTEERAEKPYAAILKIVDDWYEILMEGLSEHDQLLFRDLLGKIYYNSINYTDVDPIDAVLMKHITMG
jgi:DNA-binding MarR family transcriptional regulator